MTHPAAVMARPSAASLPSYPAAGAQLAAALGANRGDLNNNEAGWLRSTGGNAGSITWQTTIKRSGVGSFRIQGGNITAGEMCITNDSTVVTAVDATEGWLGFALYIDTLHSNAVKIEIATWNIAGTSGATGSLDKPSLKLLNDGKLYLGSSNGATQDTLVTTLATDTWYYVLMHGRTSNGADALSQECFVYNGLTGSFIASASKLWDVGAGSAGDRFKVGLSTTGNSTGLDVYVEDFACFKGLSTNPGPILIYTRRPAAVSAAGNWTAEAPLGTPGGTIPANTDDVDYDGDATVAQVTSATASSLILDLDAINIPSADVVHGVQSWIAHRYTGLAPTVTLGVRVSGTDGLVSISTTPSYADRRTLHALNPATGAAWTEAAGEGFQGVIRDADAAARQTVVTSAAWDVVTAQVAA